MLDNSSTCVQEFEVNPVIEAAQKYLTGSARFATMRDIGKQLGVSSHAIGRKLKEIGLRTAEGKPSTRALEGGFTKTVRFNETFPMNVWNQDKTMHISYR